MGTTEMSPWTRTWTAIGQTDRRTDGQTDNYRNELSSSVKHPSGDCQPRIIFNQSGRRKSSNPIIPHTVPGNKENHVQGTWQKGGRGGVQPNKARGPVHLVNPGTMISVEQGHRKITKCFLGGEGKLDQNRGGANSGVKDRPQKQLF